MTTVPEALSQALQHHQAGRLHEAEPIYRKILAIRPDHAESWHLLGMIAHQVGKHEIAVEYIERAISLSGAQDYFHNNLGEAYRGLGKAEEAADCFRRAIQGRPDFAEAYNNLGITLAEQGKLDEAVECYTRAINLKADYGEAQCNLGNIFKQQEMVPEAVECYRRALELKPGHAGAYYNLGIVERERGHVDEAFDCFRHAIQRRPDFAEAHNGLGNLLMDQGKLDEALACYRRALQLKPDDAAALLSLVHGLQHTCHWDNLHELSHQAIEVIDNSIASGKPTLVSPFYYLCLPTLTTSWQQLRCARKAAEHHHNRGSKQSGQTHFGRSHFTSARRLKLTIGYLSADFRAHPVAYLIAELFEKHDREHFTVIGYSYGRDDGSPIRRRLVNGVDRFVDLQSALTLEAAQHITADEVDILVDLTGFTKDSRSQILALRPAPIQVNYLGYPGTMGASFMDYILVDDFIVPPERQPFFTEQLVHLPGCYQVNDGQREISSQTPSRGECGLPEEGFIFCNFNNCYKITPAMFDVWMDLLKAVSDSVLWLLAGHQHAQANLRREAEARGVAGERLVFAPYIPVPAHLARYRLADLFVDSYPYNAHTTASDALWVGCPLLTLAGETFASRVAGSLLQTIGLPELITTNLDEYRNLALQLTQDPAQMSELRTRLQVNRQTSPLFDSTTFARNLEQAYHIMWERHCSGREPVGFRVSPPTPSRSPTR